MKTLICGGHIVNEGHTVSGNIEIENDCIVGIQPNDGAPCPPRDTYDTVVDATGCFVLPGVIDSHVHFREPGLTHKACIDTESRAAAYGGVTSFMDMPNTVPQTTTVETLAEKHALARQTSHVNYSFFFGATNDNVAVLKQLDRSHLPGIKLFMGSSTGNMLVDRIETLQQIFQETARLRLPLMTHCEDTATINRNMAEAQQEFGDDPPMFLHQLIRSEEACYDSTLLATCLANAYGTQIHVAHVSTAKELELAPPSAPLLDREGWGRGISFEAVVAHLLFTNRDYATLGSRIKCNPSVKSPIDRDALREGLVNRQIATIATDHAPHLLSEKEGGCRRAASGMPMVQFSLPAMLGLVDEGVLTIERMVELMSHNPARIFHIEDRGFLRPGYKADIAIVRPHTPWTLTADDIQSRCGWSPLEGRTFQWQVQQTLCNGHVVYDRHRPQPFDADYRGEPLTFHHPPVA